MPYEAPRKSTKAIVGAALALAGVAATSYITGSVETLTLTEGIGALVSAVLTYFAVHQTTNAPKE